MGHAFPVPWCRGALDPQCPHSTIQDLVKCFSDTKVPVRHAAGADIRLSIGVIGSVATWQNSFQNYPSSPYVAQDIWTDDTPW